MTSADRTSHRVSAAVSALWSPPAWQATGNALAGLLVAAVGGILLGGLALIWGAALYSLVHWPVGGWAHAVLYIAAGGAGPGLGPWGGQGGAAPQRAPPRGPPCPAEPRGPPPA